MYIKIPLF